MGNKKIVIGVLAVLLAAGIAGVFAAVPVAGSAHSIIPAGPGGSPGAISQSRQEPAVMGMPGVARSHLPGGRELALVVPGWQQMNSNGFGDQQAGEVSALETFNGYLYAGTYNPTNDTRIFRSPDGVTWVPVTEPGFGNSHDIAPWAILDMTVFNNYLYAGTGRRNASQLWRSQNGLIWAPMDVTGFSHPDNVDITALAEYDGKIYAGVTNRANGAQIWSSFTGDNNTWTQQVSLVVPEEIAASVTALTVFSDTLYAAIEFESDLPARILRSGGGAWETVVSDGFGDSNTMMTGGMAVFGAYLYVGAGNTANGAQLWRTNDDINWEQVITPAFGDANNQEIETVFVFQNHLYASTKNGSTGIETWRSADGTSWEQVNQDGFGDANNTTSNGSNATAGFLGQLYMGTSNVVDGGELWRMQSPFGVDLSPDDAKSGAAGQTLIYTLLITNTGTMTDTFDLAVTGNAWVTAVSTTTITLVPGANGAFTATVDIPPGALGNDADTATVSATSEGSPARSDAAQLATTVLPVYGLALSPDDALAGQPGVTVTYTLTISNSGNLADTFSLVPTGNAWTTTLSSPSIALAAGSSGHFNVVVAIPPGALATEFDTASITATSQGNPAKSDAALLTTTVLPVYGLDLSPGTTLSGLPGVTVTYTMTITNSGNVTDTFNLSFTGNTWTTLLSSSAINLAPFAGGSFTVTVSIPSGALATEFDTATISAASQGDPAKSDSALLTTSVMPSYGLTLSPDQAKQGPAGQSVAYTLWITNTGNAADTVNLEPSGHLWNTQISPSSLALAAGAMGSVQVDVSIPPGALGNESDSATISVTSSGNPLVSDSAQLATTVTPFFGLALSPDSSLSAAPGATVTYTLSITNTGNMADSFSLVASGQTWTTTLSASQVNLAPAAAKIFTVTVAIPPGAADQETDAVTITATSQGDGSKSDAAVLTTTSVTAPVYGVALSADDSLSGPAGGQVIYTLAITNSGNVLDTFDLLPALNSWTATLSTQVVTLAAGASKTVTITVSIPLTAAASASDQVTIQATSRHDAGKSDTAVLTTVSTGLPVKIYLPAIMLN